MLIYAFANNHFSGHAPATIEQFRSIWQEKGLPPLSTPRPPHGQRNALLSCQQVSSVLRRNVWRASKRVAFLAACRPTHSVVQ